MRYSTGAAGDVIGRFDEFRGVESLDGARLRRPDGQRPPRDPKLVPSTEGFRDDEGVRLLGEADVLAQADQAFRRAAGEARAAISDESRC